MLNEHSVLEKVVAECRQQDFNVELRGTILVVRDIPYVDSTCSIKFGILAFPINPYSGGFEGLDHTAYFIGEKPCAQNGAFLNIFANENAAFNLDGVGVARLHLSCKDPDPTKHYSTALEKLITYVNIISIPARVLDKTVTARTARVPNSKTVESPFVFLDSASDRVGIGHLNELFRNMRIGIIGLGGTGAYILDLVSKTPVFEIHLFDPDHFCQHNAFRAPGAASEDDVSGRILKVDYYKAMYDRFRHGIEAHAVAVKAGDEKLFCNLSFVFVAVDDAVARSEIVTLLLRVGVPFVDVGLGVEQLSGEKQSLTASLRVTLGVTESQHMFQTCGGNEADSEPLYRSNIQVADLNCLNAVLAVIRWKKYCTFYQDLSQEFQTVYSLNDHILVKGY